MGRLYCRVAHKVSYDFIQAHTDKNIQEVFKIEEIHKDNPFYEKLEYDLPTHIINNIRSEFNKCFRDERFYFLRDACPNIN